MEEENGNGNPSPFAMDSEDAFISALTQIFADEDAFAAREAARPKITKRKIDEDDYEEPPKANNTQRGVSIPWKVLTHPNVTAVVEISSDPFKLELDARLAGQGKHRPVPCFADEDAILNLDKLPHATKIQQQKRRRIIGKLSKAFVKFSQSNPVPPCAKACLTKTDWGALLLNQL